MWVNTVTKIENDFGSLLKDSNTGTISLAEISQAKDILSKVPKSQPITIPSIEIQKENDNIEIFTGGIESITSSLTGWKLDVFNCLLDIKKPEFTLNDVNLFITILSKKHPVNNNIEAKIRQQLQQLRDIGLVEFLAKGRYRKLWA